MPIHFKPQQAAEQESDLPVASPGPGDEMARLATELEAEGNYLAAALARDEGDRLQGHAAAPAPLGSRSAIMAAIDPELRASLSDKLRHATELLTAQPEAARALGLTGLVASAEASLNSLQAVEDEVAGPSDYPASRKEHGHG